MKKILVAFVLLLAFGYSYGQKVSGGFAVSPIVSWMKPETKDIENEKIKFGFTYGALVDINFILFNITLAKTWLTE